MDLRPSPLAGLWYPARPDALAASVDAFLAEARGPDPSAQPDAPPGPCAVVGLLAPHAGHRFSGLVAAHAFRAVQGLAVDVVAVLSPSHYHADAPILTSAHAAYATPLGPVLVDQPALAALRAALSRALNLPPDQAVPALRRDREHAIEIELPFLQRALAPGFSLLPLMLRDQGESLARALGAALAETLRGRRALLVASSDLSHFSPQAAALERDAALLQPVAALDPAGVLAVQAAGKGQACGAGAIAAVLWAAQALGANRAQVVRHATSGDVTGDYDAVVGYAAALLWKC
jgi:AmmeMemoRadiSam system protein B